jgi:hypothetical protein
MSFEILDVDCSSDGFYWHCECFLDLEEKKPNNDDPEMDDSLNNNLFKSKKSSKCLLPQSKLSNLAISSSSRSSFSLASPLIPPKSFASPAPHASSPLPYFSLSSSPSCDPFHSSSPATFENPETFFPKINHSSSEKGRVCKNI